MVITVILVINCYLALKTWLSWLLIIQLKHQCYAMVMLQELKFNNDALFNDKIIVKLLSFGVHNSDYLASHHDLDSI